MFQAFFSFYLVCMLVTCMIHLCFLAGYHESGDEESEISAWMVLTTFFAPLFILYVIGIFIKDLFDENE